MVEFEKSLSEFAEIKTSVFAFSTDSLENTKDVIEKNELTLRIMCEVDGPELVKKLGAYYEERRKILHTSSFVLKGDKIMSLTISNGPIGRITAIDAIRFIKFNQKND